MAAEAGGQVVLHDNDDGDDMPDLFDLFGEDFFELALPDGGTAQVEDESARKYLAAQRRAAQLEYEDALLMEVRKLQQLAKQSTMMQKQQEKETQERVEREQRARKDEEERRRKQLEKEAAAEELEKRHAAEWAKKQRESEERAAEIERQKREAIKRERFERQRALQIAREKQQGIAAKALQDRERQAAIKRQLDEQKQAALLARMEERRKQRLAENRRKAKIAAERVYKAWEARRVQLEEAEHAFKVKHIKQEKRMQDLEREKARKQELALEKAAEKRTYIERVISEQLSREEAMKRSVEVKHNMREAALRHAQEEMQHSLALRGYERLAQQHHARDKVLQALDARRVKIEELEESWNDKDQRTTTLLRTREDEASKRLALFSLLRRERQTVMNTMDRSKVTKRFELPLHIRKNISDSTLKLVLDKADPQQTGIITLAANGSGLSEQELQQTRKVFSKLDSNGDGEIDYSEFKSIMNKLMRQRGEQRKTEEWFVTAFAKVDKDGNGQIDFDEFLEAMHSGSGRSSAFGTASGNISKGGLEDVYDQ